VPLFWKRTRPARGLQLAGLVCLALLAGCGGASHRGPAGHAASTPAADPSGAAFGLTEDNAVLLAAPADARARADARVQAARSELAALAPTYVRLLVDWAALQPDPARGPALGARVDGCARGVRPCAAYAGIRAELAALAARQRTAGGERFQVVIDVLGTPAWAARAPSGCEAGGRGAFSRTLEPGAIADYRRLIRSLLALGAREGVALRWWSPWNEPNDPVFTSPQRGSCSASARPLAPEAYAELARAMAAELRSDGGGGRLLLGELNAYQADAADRTSIASFIDALPADVLCLSGEWSIHVYAARAEAAPAVDPVTMLERALDARGGCARGAHVWVTEAGAGAPHPGAARPAGAADEIAGCVALAEQLARWYRDPRVDAVLQYTFREDPAFPVGLASADLSHLYPSYRLWLRSARLRAEGRPPPAPGPGCA
jgi:hypothetical protein